MAGKSDFTDPSKRILPITALAPMGSQQIRDLSPSFWFGPLQPVRTSAPSSYRPRQYAYPPGANIIWQPKGEDPISYEVLRGLADSWDLLRIIITTQLDRICSCEWEIRAKQKAGESNEDRKKRNLEDSDVQALLTFFKKPDGFHPWKTWLRMWMEDCIVLDAVALYLARDTKGKVATIHPLDGATINRLLTDQGITPPPPSAAYQQVVYGCYMEGTEVLTRNGWKIFDDVHVGDQIATRNPKTKVFEWQAATAKQHYHHDGDIYRFRSEVMDLGVTPDHRMVIRRLPHSLGGNQYRSGEAVVTARDLSEHRTLGSSIPVTSNWKGTPVQPKRFPEFGRDLHFRRLELDARIQESRDSGMSANDIAHNYNLGIASVYRALSLYRSRARKREPREGLPMHICADDWCALMGLWLSEGSCNGTTVQIAQCPNSTRFDEIRSVLTRIMGRVPNHAANAFHICNKPLADYLRQFGHSHEKYIPDEILNAPPRQLEIFWHHYWLGDGVYDRPQICTTSKRMADQLQEVAQKLGSWTIIRERQPKDHVFAGRVIKAENCHPVYTVYRRKTVGYHNSYKIDKEHYSGYVDCVTVPNGVIYVRRNGKPIWCGNSPCWDFTTDDMLFAMRNERTNRRYGYGPVEQIIRTVCFGIRRQSWQIAEYTEGNVPEALVFLPSDLPIDRVKEVQDWFDSMLSGELGQRRRVRFLPGYGTGNEAKPNIIFPKEPLLKDELDVWLAQIACMCIGIRRNRS